MAQPRGAVDRAVAGNPAAAGALRSFLGHPCVRSSGTWGDVFGADPPRGTLARVARKLGARLDPACRAWAWETRDEFKGEVKRIQRWYATGRRTSRARLGILRTRHLGSRIECVNCVMTPTVKHHYKKLLDPVRLDGLWNWRAVAQALHGAGIGVQSGTVPVERLWSSLQHMFPKKSQHMSLAWFNLLAKLAYFRFNYRHFHGQSSPAWTEDDSLLAERLGDIRAVLYLDTGCGGTEPPPPGAAKPTAR